MTGLSTDLPDRDDRIRAVTCFDANLVVEAGAGTGKTSLLVERILVALGAGHATLEQITAITFTEKAAAEMRTRLATGLERLLRLCRREIDDPDPGFEADRADLHLTAMGIDPALLQERILAALHRIDRAQVNTIHTFCAGLLRAWPMAAGVEPGFDIDQGDHYDRILDEEWERFVVEALADNGQAETWRTLLGKIALGDLQDVAFALAGFGVPREILENPCPDIDPRNLFRPDIEATLGSARGILAMRDPGKAKPPMPATVLAALHGGFAVLLEEGYARFRQHVESSEELQRRLNQASTYKPSSANGFVDLDVETLRKAIRDGMELLRALMQSDDATVSMIVGVAAPFAAGARERLLQQGFVGFDGLLNLTRDLLRDHPDIREKVRRGTRMILVDEFQDTDPVQYEIVLYLAERSGESNPDPYLANLEPGRLFVVGDPKQSIYRFRGADYSAFKAAVDRILDQGGSRLVLKANFRTIGEILEPINRLFGERSGSPWVVSEQHQPPYIPLTPTRNEGGVQRVEVWNTPADETPKAPVRRALEAEAIAAEIEKTVRGSDGTSYSGIMILVRAFSNLEIYLRALRDRRIPYVVDGGKGFMERSEVTQLIATARAVSLPSDQAALLSFLRSPAAGVSDVQLAAYAVAGGAWDWRRFEQVNVADHGEIHQAFSLLASMADAVQDLPADTAVRTIVRMAGMQITGALAFEGSQRVANIGKLCAVASDLARDGRMSLVELLDHLKDEKFTESDSESPMADEKTDSVRVLSIHKAKGLECDTVIVPDLARSTTDHTPPKLEVGRLPDGTSAASVRLPDLRNLVSWYREREEKAHEEAENIRLLYVAVTRPKNRLIVVSGWSQGRSPWVDAIAAWNRPDQGILNREMERPGSSRRGNGSPTIQDTSGLAESFRSVLDGVQGQIHAPFQAPSTHDEERFTGSEEPDRLPRHDGASRDEAKELGT
ncbi:MAG: UvrD-helicase domain-containing protein, partial [Acidobacteria bacterium]|nr:UvrD-helicase domain-containing protein [Candidatus Polarisedimenticola svalbardensis]